MILADAPGAEVYYLYLFGHKTLCCFCSESGAEFTETRNISTVFVGSLSATAGRFCATAGPNMPFECGNLPIVSAHVAVVSGRGASVASLRRGTGQPRCRPRRCAPAP